MPTLPSEQPGEPERPEPSGQLEHSEQPQQPEGSRLAVRDSHRARHIAESFGTDAERYERARPPYPEALIDRIVSGSPGRDVLDAGCGTGIAARQFLAAGCRVLGVEPDARMAEVARRFGVEVEVSTLEAWEPAGRGFDAVVAAQSWHWIDPVAGAAKAARVLRPGGRLAAFWHVFQLPPDIAEAFAEVYERVVPEAPVNVRWLSGAPETAYAPMLAKAADGFRTAGGFGDAEEWRFDWERRYTRETWLDQLPTIGLLTRLPQDRLAELLDGVGAAVDKAGGSFTMRYATIAVTATRVGGS
ncbi:class I SAM-dependent methyltransferase [Streptomyces sp. NPDC088196]|uniref:class I SAM-dependent methyltransferase n=1 Tax=Streptomyces sp. NPDC088196 TaxID=3154868 RepID=UPI0034504EF2